MPKYKHSIYNYLIKQKLNLKVGTRMYLSRFFDNRYILNR